MGRYNSLVEDSSEAPGEQPEKAEHKQSNKETDKRTNGQTDNSPRGEISVSPSSPPNEEVLIVAAATSLLDEYTKAGNYKMSGTEKKRFANMVFFLKQEHFAQTNNIELLRAFIAIGLEDWERNGEESKVYKVLQKYHHRSF